MCVCVCVCVYACICVCVSLCVSVHPSVCLNLKMCLYACVHVCVGSFIFVYLYDKNGITHTLTMCANIVYRRDCIVCVEILHANILLGKRLCDMRLKIVF